MHFWIFFSHSGHFWQLKPKGLVAKKIVKWPKFIKKSKRGRKWTKKGENGQRFVNIHNYLIMFNLWHIQQWDRQVDSSWAITFPVFPDMCTWKTMAGAGKLWCAAQQFVLLWRFRVGKTVLAFKCKLWNRKKNIAKIIETKFEIGSDIHIHTYSVPKNILDPHEFVGGCSAQATKATLAHGQWTH